MSSFISFDEGSRNAISEFSKNFSQTWENTKYNEQQELFNRGQSSYSSADYGFNSIGDSDSEGKDIVDLLRCWYLHNGMDAASILSDSEENVNKRHELMDSFNNTFIKDPDESEAGFRKRVNDNLMAMQNTSRSLNMLDALPVPGTTYDAEKYENMLITANLYGDISERISQVFNELTVDSDYLRDVGIVDPEAFFKSTDNSQIGSFCRDVTMAFSELASASAEDLAVETQSTRVRRLFPIVSEYRTFYEANIGDFSKNTLKAGNLSENARKDIERIAPIANSINDAPLEGARVSSQTYNQLFVDEYTAPQPQAAQNGSPEAVEYHTLDPMYFLQTPDDLLDSLAEFLDVEEENVLDYIYLNNHDLSGLERDEAAEIIKDAMRLDSPDFVAIKTKGGGYIDVRPPFAASDNPMFKASEEAARARNEQKAEISKQNIENLNCLGDIFEAIPDVPEDKTENVEKARDNVNKAIENLDSEALKEAMIELGNNILPDEEKRKEFADALDGDIVITLDDYSDFVVSAADGYKTIVNNLDNRRKDITSYLENSSPIPIAQDGASCMAAVRRMHEVTRARESYYNRLSEEEKNRYALSYGIDNLFINGKRITEIIAEENPDIMERARKSMRHSLHKAVENIIDDEIREKVVERIAKAFSPDSTETVALYDEYNTHTFIPIVNAASSDITNTKELADKVERSAREYREINAARERAARMIGYSGYSRYSYETSQFTDINAVDNNYLRSIIVGSSKEGPTDGAGIMHDIGCVYINGVSPIADMQIPDNPSEEYILQNILPAAVKRIKEALASDETVIVYDEHDFNSGQFRTVSTTRMESIYESQSIMSPEEMQKTVNRAKNASESANALNKVNEAVYWSTREGGTSDIGGRKVSADLDGNKLISAIIGAELPDNASDKELREAIGKIYIDGKNITDIVGQPVNGNTLSVYTAKIKEALSPENTSFMTCMRENSVEPRPVAILTTPSSIGLKPGQLENWAEKSQMSLAFARSLKDGISLEVNKAKEAPAALNAKLAGGQNSDFFAWIEDYNNDIKAQNPGIAENDNRLLTYDKCTAQLSHLHIESKESVPANLMMLYMLGKKDNNGNNYTLDFIMSDTPEAKAAKKKIGKEFFEEFSLGAENAGLRSEREVLAKPSLSQKYREHMIPALETMTATLSELKLPYVDYSSPESISQNLAKFNIISSMVSNYAANTFDSFKTPARTMSENIRTLTNMSNLRDKYISCPAYKESNYFVNSDLSELTSPEVSTLINYEYMRNVMGNDAIKNMGDTSLGFMRSSSAHDINNISANYKNNKSLGNREAVSMLKGDWPLEKADKSGQLNGAINKFANDMAAAKKDTENGLNAKDALYKNAIPDMGIRTAKSSISPISLVNIESAPAPQLLSALTGYPASSFQKYDDKVFREALSKVYVNGQPVMRKFQFDALDDKVRWLESGLTAEGKVPTTPISQTDRDAQISKAKTEIVREYNKAFQYISKTLKETLLEGSSTDYIMCKTDDTFIGFVPAGARLPVMQEPKKVEKFGFLKRLASSPLEIRKNELEVELYEKNLAAYNKRAAEESMRKDIIKDIEHQVNLLNTAARSSNYVKAINVSVLQRDGMRNTERVDYRDYNVNKSINHPQAANTAPAAAPTAAPAANPAPAPAPAANTAAAPAPAPAPANNQPTTTPPTIASPERAAGGRSM